MKVYDLRGKDLSDPLRKEAYPSEKTYELGRPLTYMHLESASWYFDASDPRNEAEASRVVSELCFRAETQKYYSDGYKPLHIVVDNFGGTVSWDQEGELKMALQDKTVVALEAYLAQREELTPTVAAAKEYNDKTERVREAIRMLRNESKDYWYFYLPRHIAGSGSNTYIGKVEDTEDNVRARFEDCATIDSSTGIVTFYARPKKEEN